MSKHVFCRTLMLERGEPHEGTGEISPRFLMMAWPKGKWRVPRYESADMSPELRRAIRDAMLSQATDNSVELVEGSPGQVLPTLLAYPEGRFLSPEGEAETIAAIDAWTSGQPLPGESDDRITILCCTDAKRDACCARFGFATYKALVATADPARFNVLQCTHLGGCRFAASLIVLPAGQRYGRLAPEEVPAFLGALERGEIYLPASRGNPRLDEPAQAAELAVMRWGAERGRSQSSARLDAREEIDPDHIVFAARSDGQMLSVSVATRIFEIHGACSSIGVEPPDIEKRWIVDQIGPEAEAKSAAGRDSAVSM